MTRDEAQTILQPIHAMEQRTGRMICRKQLRMLLPEMASFNDERFLIKAWQDGYFERFSNVMRFQAREALIKSVTGQ